MLTILIAVINSYSFLFTASALKCWRCSSDASNAAFCGDPFDASIITEPQRRWGYTECSQPPQAQNPYSQNQPIQRTVCKKIKQISKSSSIYFLFLKKNTNIANKISMIVPKQVP